MDRRNVSTFWDPPWDRVTSGFLVQKKHGTRVLTHTRWQGEAVPSLVRPVLQLSVNRTPDENALLLHHHVTPKKVGTGVGYDPKIQIGLLDQL